MFEEDNAQWGLVHALVLDGKGGARSIARTELDDLQLQPQESLWLHWDRSHPQTRTWLLHDSGLSEFACELLLEENTRPRLLPLADEQMLLFLRGVNLNPGAEPEDMVSVRIFAEARRMGDDLHSCQKAVDALFTRAIVPYALKCRNAADLLDAVLAAPKE